MNDDQQDTDMTSGQENVMERVLDTFDALVDDAAAFIADTTTNVGKAGGEFARDLGNRSAGDIAADAGDAATSLGETASDVATRITAALAAKLDALASFAAGLLGG